MTVTTGTNAGFLGRNNGGATIRNLGLLRVNITGTSSSSGIAGDFRNSIVENCFVTGTVAGNGTSGYGGIIGNASNSSVIQNCVSLVTSVLRTGGTRENYMRVASSIGGDAATAINNYALASTQVLTAGTLVSPTDPQATPNGIHGATISAANIGTVNTILQIFADRGNMPVISTMASLTAPLTFSVTVETDNGTMAAILPVEEQFVSAFSAFEFDTAETQNAPLLTEGETTADFLMGEQVTVTAERRRASHSNTGKTKAAKY